ncbi:MAG: flavin reductase family protein [Chloroflexota bacterium]|jgi:flavin reductase (DIM6/NTAB) family NADH-FMN oxidoreductase RutF|nr:flavin reductase family protein [Chloroflexota bacterium]
MAISGELFREVFQRWPSGVAVATTTDLDGAPYGMIVGSFCSLSREPPLVMMSAGTTARMHDVIARSGRYAINIISHEQRDILDRFAGFDRTYDENRFEGYRTQTAVTGAPVFPASVAWVDCEVRAAHNGDGYTIYVAEVVAASLGESSDQMPMVYFRRTPRTVTAGDWQI